VKQQIAYDRTCYMWHAHDGYYK